MKHKKLALIVIIVLIAIIFIIIYYKNYKPGNTIINKSEEEIVKNILEMKYYQATLEIAIKSNKNETKYKIRQTLQEEGAKQEILEPENIAGVTTEYDGTNLKIRNNKLNLETIFENYQYMVENRLWLDSFIEEYKTNQNTKTISNENEIILEVKNENKPYNVYKKLYIDKKTGNISKMTIQDINKKMLVYILYTEIEIS